MKALKTKGGGKEGDNFSKKRKRSLSYKHWRGGSTRGEREAHSLFLEKGKKKRKALIYSSKGGFGDDESEY